MGNTKSVAIVTGASQGIGRATAVRLARNFSVIVLVARDKENLEKSAAEVMSLGAEAMTSALDLRQPESVKSIIAGTLQRFGRIDALLNIAGAVPQVDLFQMTDAQWDDGMALKLNGARRLTIEAGDALKASTGLAKAFTEQGIKDGVQVNSVSPGAVMTGRRRAFFETWAPAHNLTVEEAIKKFPEQAGITRFGKPEEIADLIGYLVSPAAK